MQADCEKGSWQSEGKFHSVPFLTRVEVPFHNEKKISLQVIRQPFMTDRLVLKLKEKENALHCVYLNDFNMVIAAFVLQCNEAKNWYDGITKARHIFVKLKQGTFNIDAQGHSVRVSLQQQQHSLTTDNISIRKSPLGSSIGKHWIINWVKFVRNN